MFKAKKLQLEADKAVFLKCKAKLEHYQNSVKTAKNNGMKAIAQSKVDELAEIIDIIERRCKVLTK